MVGHQSVQLMYTIIIYHHYHFCVPAKVPVQIPLNDVLVRNDYSDVRPGRTGEKQGLAKNKINSEKYIYFLKQEPIATHTG